MNTNDQAMEESLQLDREMTRVWRVLRKNKVSANRAAQIVSYARGLNQSQLLLFVMHIFAGLGNAMAKKKLYKKLRENVDPKELKVFQPLLVPLMEDLSPTEDEPEEEEKSVIGMTLRELLAMGPEEVTP